ncbi:homoserine dehydrogenase [Brevibacillus ruminantium]|uniref:Homoserine dehydrogenase n=1 Tax=Brevibacillus ruminantium TaxID=2950604 RepID=A0ABY4WL99_9BACL|nr:homoserine dehydrogenase [Brevibacillus ruminantium]USG67629.1 homoserine dehydrogenase [Brevibacillus ruminantium]
MSTEAVKVGLLGVGTVGGGVLKTIRLQQQKLSERLGRPVEIVKALVRDPGKKRTVELDHDLITTRFEEVLKSDVDIVVEVMGGVEPAYEYVRALIEKGCHIVTANKELLARHGTELIQLANRHQVQLAYEASVAGGIPILGVLRQFLRTNDISSVSGILNGTTNFILTQMEQAKLPYHEALKQAQELGYAEADPSSDVEGWDALYKSYILAQLVFGEALPLNQARRRGIDSLHLGQLTLAHELGYRIKLLAQATKAEGGVQLSVSPTLLPLDHPLAQVQGADNAVQVSGNIVGDLLFMGKGAGELPTASAVVEDLAYLLTQRFSPHPLWRERQGNHGVGKEGTWSFVYLESTGLQGTPEQILHFLNLGGVSIAKQRIQYDWANVLRIGVIARGFTDEHRAALQRDFGIQTDVFPVISRGEEQDILGAKGREVDGKEIHFGY